MSKLESNAEAMRDLEEEVKRVNEENTMMKEKKKKIVK
jgi:hypothetical protein